MNFARADAWQIPLADQSVDMVFTSPPYTDRRTYGMSGVAMKCETWAGWMGEVVVECLRVCKGPVFINCDGCTKDWNYQPAPELLIVNLFRRGIIQRRPSYVHRHGISGSGGKDYLRSDIEQVLCFTNHRGPFPWSENTAMGKPPKWRVGGLMSHRTKSGSKVHTKRSENGIMRKQTYRPPKISNPGNLIKILVGGGNLGHKLAHENEAPFSEKLVEFYVRSFAPPGGIVLDPFSGSGTTVSVSERLGRIGVGFDIRQNQCLLGRERTRIQTAQGSLFPVEAMP